MIMYCCDTVFQFHLIKVYNTETTMNCLKLLLLENRSDVMSARPDLYVFLAVQNSSIGDLVTD